MLGVRFISILAGTLASIICGTAVAQETVTTAQPAPAFEQPSTPPNAAAPAPTPPAPTSTPATEGVSRVAAPTPAASAVSPEPTAPKPQPNWNIGAGIAYGSGDSATFVGYFLNAPSTPAYRVGFERRVYRGCWLAFTGSLLHASYDAPVSSQLDPATRTTINVQNTTAAALLGVRQALITDIVEFSWYGAAAGAWAWTGGDVLEEGETAQGPLPGGFARTLGFSSGISVERQLIDRLAVRLSTEILSLQWSKWTPGQTYEQSIGEEPQPITQHSQTTLLHVAPAIDLRFYF